MKAWCLDRKYMRPNKLVALVYIHQIYLRCTRTLLDVFMNVIPRPASHQIVLESQLMFSSFAGVLIITGLAIYGTRVNENLPPYSATLLVCAGFLSIIGGIFGAVGLSRS